MNRWAPELRRTYVFGEVHGAKEPVSSRHWNAPGSFAANANVATLAVVFAFGREPIVVWGAVASIAHAREAAAMFPAASVARTAKPWSPSRRPAYDAGELQDSKPRPSRLHWNVAGLSAEKEKLVVLLLTRPAAPDVIASVGARVSIVHAYAASGPVFARASLALATNVWRPSPRLLYVCGEAQDANAPSSSLHWNVAASFAEKAKVAERLFVGSAGLSLIAVVGPVVSIVHA